MIGRLLERNLEKEGSEDKLEAGEIYKITNLKMMHRKTH